MPLTNKKMVLFIQSEYRNLKGIPKNVDDLLFKRQIHLFT